MFEAKLNEAAMLKKLLDAVKELVADANFECSDEGVNLQAMDNSHVALVAVKLDVSGFSKYRCDRAMPLGMNLGSLTKVMKCAKDDDTVELHATDDADVLNLKFESKSSDRISQYDLKLMDIDSETLGIPETEYEAKVTMPSSEFTRIVRDLTQLGESVRIEVSKDGVRFASEGESANGNVLLRPSGSITSVKEEEDTDEKRDDDEDDLPKAKKIKKEKKDNDVDMDEKGEEEEEAASEKEDEEVEDEEGSESGKKRKRSGGGKPSKKAKTSEKKGKKAASEDDDFSEVFIEMNSHVALTFSLKYLVNFSKSGSLSKKVQLKMSNDVPLLVAYDFGQGNINYYLAPKIGDD